MLPAEAYSSSAGNLFSLRMPTKRCRKSTAGSSPTIASHFVAYNVASDYGKLRAQHGLEVVSMLELTTQLAWAIYMCKLRSCTVNLFNLDRIWWGLFPRDLMHSISDQQITS